MIKPQFLKKQLNKTQKEKQTSEFIRRLTFQVVNESLLERYPETYPMKCLQSSVAVQKVLQHFGICSKLVVGNACMAQVFHGNSNIGWHGFWGEHHHHWIHTEYQELVDLTIRYVHIHPAIAEPDQIEMPSIWWDKMDESTSVISYVGDYYIEYPKFPDDEDKKDLVLFEELVQSNLELKLSNVNVADVAFEPIIAGMRSLNDLHQKGNAWVNKSFLMHEADVPLPEDFRLKQAAAIPISNEIN